MESSQIPNNIIRFQLTVTPFDRQSHFLADNHIIIYIFFSAKQNTCKKCGTNGYAEVGKSECRQLSEVCFLELYYLKIVFLII